MWDARSMRHRAVERALPLPAREGRIEPRVDIGLHRRVACEHVGLFEPGERRRDWYRVQLGVQPRLMVGFQPVGDHDIGAVGDQLVKDAGIVVMDDHRRLPEMARTKASLAEPGLAMTRTPG